MTAHRGRPWAQLVPVLAGIADALAILHARGIVHRDLKPANVLIGDDGMPVLADFGLAAAIGDAGAPRGGSPFCMSPQQFDGHPPAAADDVYGFGALAYESLCGYPPFYPDARPERIRNEPPAPLPVRLAVPPTLERLVLGCLAKEPQQRPPTAAGLASALRALATAAVAAKPARRSSSVELRPPPSMDATIDPQWSRTAAPGPTPQQWQTQGFRRGLVAASFVFLSLAAAFVFFVLPRQVERSAVREPQAQAPAAATTAPPPSAEPDLQALAEAKRAFEELRPTVSARLEALEKRAARDWGGDAFARGKQSLADADAAFGRRDYEPALASLRSADSDLAATERNAASQLAAAMAAGRAALDAGDATTARRQFERALAIEPGNAAARRGVERSGTLDEVRKLLADAALLENRGQVAAAESAYRKALALDRDTQSAREALARLEARGAADAFSAAMSQGLEPGGSGRGPPRLPTASRKSRAAWRDARSRRTSSPRRKPSGPSAGPSRSPSIARHSMSIATCSPRARVSSVRSRGRCSMRNWCPSPTGRSGCSRRRRAVQPVRRCSGRGPYQRPGRC
jgi:tetratricopeptide (TPR) repeat protein